VLGGVVRTSLAKGILAGTAAVGEAAVPPPNDHAFRIYWRDTGLTTSKVDEPNIFERC
jgi:hypothetical protein